MSARFLKTLAFLGAILMAGTSLLLAQTSPQPLRDLTSSPISSLCRVLAAFALVLAVFGALIWALKNWQRLVVHRGMPLKLQVLEAKSLGQRHALYVVGYDEQRLLLAASPTGVALLSHLPPGPAQERIQSNAAPAPTWAAIVGLVAKSCRR